MITALASIIVAISISITSFVQTLTLSGFKIIDCCGSKCVQDEKVQQAKPSCTTLDLFWLLLFELGDHCIIIGQCNFVCWFVSHTFYLFLLLLCWFLARTLTIVWLDHLASLGGIAFDPHWICTRHLFVRCFVCCFTLARHFFSLSIQPRHFGLHSCCWKAQPLQRRLAVAEWHRWVRWVRWVFQIGLWYFPFTINARTVDVSALAPLHSVQNHSNRCPT